MQSRAVLVLVVLEFACQPASLSISPREATVQTGASVQFSATRSDVRWRLEGGGTLSETGEYTAPPYVPYPAAVTIHASVGANTVASTSLTITSPREDWPKYHRDAANSGRSGETAINAETAAHLQLKWSFTTPGGRVSASPAVATINGVSTLFIGAWNGVFHALNAETGAALWRFDIDLPPLLGTCADGTQNCTRIGSSAAVADGRVYFGAGNGFVYCLDAASGALIWKAQAGDATSGAEVWTSPVLGDGKVYFALASHNGAPCVAGQVFAYDAASGAKAWTFDVIQGCPAGKNCVGGGIWSSPAFDASGPTPLLYVSTGNAGNGCAPASNATPAAAYANAILALDASTGALRNFFQPYPSDPDDHFDFGASPVLYASSACEGGPARRWVSTSNKGGSVFSLARGDGGIEGAAASGQLALEGAGLLIATPAVVPEGAPGACNALYVPSASGALWKLRQADDGAGTLQPLSDERWPAGASTTGACANGSCPLLSAPATAADVIVFGGGEGNLYVYKHDGTRLFSFGASGLVASGPAISGGRVYFGSYGAKNASGGRDGVVYCLSIDGK